MARTVLVGFVVFLFFFIGLGCEERQGITDERIDEIAEIFKAYQWENAEVKQKVIEKYQLHDPEKFRTYKKMIEQLSLERDKWESFLEKVAKEL